NHPRTPMSMDPIVVLDLGTSTVRVLVGEESPDGDWKITGIGHNPSRGMRKGACGHLDDASDAARAALAMAEDAASMSIRSVVLPISGVGIRSRQSRVELAVKDTVTEDHVSQILAEARRNGIPADCKLLHNVVQRYHLDQLSGVNPVGLEGSILALDSLLVYGEHRALMNLVHVAKNLGLEVAEPYFSGLCAASACLDAEQKQQGVLLIDLGAGVTSCVAYAQGAMADAAVFPVGASNVTNDIAAAFRLTSDAAETLKRQHGDAMINHTLRNRHLTSSASRTPIKIPDFQTVIHVRLEETFGLVFDALKKKELLNRFGAGIVLTGGGARLANAATLAEHVFRLPCTIGTPRAFPDLPPLLDGPEWATAVGALRLGIDSQLAKTPLPRTFLKRLRSFVGLD
ncbi:MAG: cell division protein FtsA, partial [Kiritimatiellae bacterium]|nr:cell division protein FtsA [Kiritimatiellia bacterium]